MSDSPKRNKPAAKAPAKEAPKRATPAEKLATKRTKAEVVQKILERMEDKLSSDEMRATLGDYIRLVQLEKELEDDEPREIKVTWVEPKTESEE